MLKKFIFNLFICILIISQYNNDIFIKANDNKYFIKLNDEEKQWVEKNKKDIHILINSIPDETFFYNYDNQQRGIIKDLLNLMEKELKIKITIHTKQYNMLFKEDIKEYDMFFGFINTDLFKDQLVKTRPIYNNEYIIYSKQPFNSMMDFDRKNIGFIDKQSKDEFLENYPLLKFKAVIKQKKETLIYMMKKNNVDAIVSTKELTFSEAYKDLEINKHKLPIAFEESLLVNKRHIQLVQIINKYIGYLLEKQKLNSIINKNIQEFTYVQLKLSEKERNWLMKNKDIPIIIGNNQKPFDYLDENYKYTGINAEYLKKIGALIGVNFKPISSINVNTIKEKEHTLITGQAYLMPFYTKNMNFYHSNIIITNPYYSHDITVLGNGDSHFVTTFNDLNNKKIVIPTQEKDHSILPFINDAKIITSDNLSSAIELLNDKKADYIIGNIATFDYILKNSVHNNIKIVGNFDLKIFYHFAVSPAYKELASVLDKTIKVVSFDPLLENNEMLKSDNTKDKALKLSLVIIFIIFTISLIVLHFVLWLRKRRLKVDKYLETNFLKYEKMIYQIVETLEEASTINDVETGTHTKRVSQYCEFLSTVMGKDKEFIKKITQYASLHDLGKIGIPSHILKKPGKLTQKEFTIMKQHVKIGAEFVEKLNLDNMAINVVKYHHENYDGTGYLWGLQREEIPIEARIMSLADVYDALRMKRVYKPAFSHEKAVEIILSEKGKKFDPIIIDVFMKHHEGFKKIYSKNSI